MKKKAFFCVVLAGIFLGTSCIFANLLSPYGFSPLQMTAMGGTVAAVVMATAVFFYDKKLYKTDLKGILLAVCCGIGIYFTSSFYLISMEKTSASTASVLTYTSPIIVMFYSVIFLKEKFTKIKAISVISVILGCCLVSGVIGGFKFNTAGLIIGLLSGVAYAFYNIITKIAMKYNYNPLTITLYCFITMCILALICADVPNMAKLTLQNPPVIVLLIIGLGIFPTVLPYFLQTLGLKELPAGVASSLGIIEPMSATVFSVVFFNENLSVLNVCGIILILFAVFILSKTKEND